MTRLGFLKKIGHNKQYEDESHWMAKESCKQIRQAINIAEFNGDVHVQWNGFVKVDGELFHENDFCED